MNFDFVSPVQVVFGNGRINELGKIAGKYGSYPLIVTGKNAMKRYGGLEKVLGALKSEEINYGVFSGISSNPRSDEVDEAISLVRKEGYNLIIGLGGGSALDASKAISVGIPTWLTYGSMRQLIGGKAMEGDSIPVIAIPTTSGSGAEVTKGAIITDTQRGLKSGVRGTALFPRVALLDPELTYSMPEMVTRETGFDALTHAIETYVAKKASPVTDLLSEEAIRIIYEYLPRVISNGMNGEAREKMSFASLLGGMNIANASTCLPHRLQQAMGSVIDISHGRGMATLYPAWLKRVYEHRREKFDRVSELLGFKGGYGYDAVVDFMKRVGVYCSLGNYASKDDIDEFLEKISGNVENDPIPDMDKKMMREIYDESFIG